MLYIVVSRTFVGGIYDISALSDISHLSRLPGNISIK